jgi:zinc transporter ZupT
MTPIVKLYWLRVLLGAIAGVVSAVMATWVYPASDYTPLLNSITVALALYVVTYYLLKGKLKDKIEQQSKILSTAIGMYFFTWITLFVLSYTAIQVFSF